MDTLSKNKGIVIAIILFGILMLGYKMFRGSSEEETLVVTPQGVSAGAEVLTLYNRLQTVTLDQSLFKTPVYKSLIDFSVDVPMQPMGRANPFDAIGR